MSRDHRWAHRLRAALGRDGHAAPPPGAVAGLRVDSGEVRARVTAAREPAHRVSLILPVVEPHQWDTVAAALGGQPLFRARLLAGTLPVEVVRVFDVLGLPLLPRGLAEVVVSCTCAHWGGVCAHATAALDALADRLADDPFLLLAWRGCDRATLLSALRAHLPPATGPSAGDEAAPPVRMAAPPPPEDAAEFWRAPELPPAPKRSRPAAPPDTDGPLAALAPWYARLGRS